MKTKTCLKNNLWTATMGIVALSTLLTSFAAMASMALTGSYHGKVRGYEDDGHHMDLLIRPFGPDEGRDGSYLAILIRAENHPFQPWADYDPKRASIYLVDPLSAGSVRYAMTPLNVTQDGFIGAPGITDPSLVLDVIGSNEGKLKFHVITANSANTAGFQTTMEFDGSAGEVNWAYTQPGDYKFTDWDNHHTALSIAALDKDYQASATFTTKKKLFEGVFLFKEMQHGLFALQGLQVKSTGVESENFTRRIAFWTTRGSDTYLMLVDPANDRQLTVFEKK